MGFLLPPLGRYRNDVFVDRFFCKSLCCMTTSFWETLLLCAVTARRYDEAVSCVSRAVLVPLSVVADSINEAFEWLFV